MSGDIALYLHMPFCRRKCCYCSFTSFEQRETDIPLYVDTLIKELAIRSRGEAVSTIFIGGGTPSLVLAPEMEKLFSAVQRLFNVIPAAEITMEANPGTIDEDYLNALRRMGVNRLSLGVQSFNDEELAMLGRIHTAAQAKEAVFMARRAGFDNLNLDLIYGLPGQTRESWIPTLEAALELEPEHLSLYALTLEEDTPLQLIINQGGLPYTDPDLNADHYEIAEGLLAAQGYIHYEISNWAKPGKQCRHNLVYWRNLPYLGAGAAAHSCLNGHRLANTSDLDKYLADFSRPTQYHPEMDEKINPELELAETIILGLRLDEGIKRDIIKKRYGVNILEKYAEPIGEMTEAGLLTEADGHLTLTPRGRLLSNQVFYRFLPEQ
jgi:oxygen-independent coproporphyrinogen III oxidase